MKNKIWIVLLAFSLGFSVVGGDAFAKSRKEIAKEKARIEAIREEARKQEFPKTETELAYQLTGGGLFPVEYKGEKFDFTKVPVPFSQLNNTVRYDQYKNQYFYDNNGKPYFYSVPHKQTFYYKEGMGPKVMERPASYKARWKQAIENKIAEEKAAQIKAAEDKAVADDAAERKLRRKIRNQERRKLEDEQEKSAAQQVIDAVTE